MGFSYSKSFTKISLNQSPLRTGIYNFYLCHSPNVPSQIGPPCWDRPQIDLTANRLHLLSGLFRVSSAPQCPKAEQRGKRSMRLHIYFQKPLRKLKFIRTWWSSNTANMLVSARNRKVSQKLWNEPRGVETLINQANNRLFLHCLDSKQLKTCAGKTRKSCWLTHKLIPHFGKSVDISCQGSSFHKKLSADCKYQRSLYYISKFNVVLEKCPLSQRREELIYLTVRDENLKAKYKSESKAFTYWNTQKNVLEVSVSELCECWRWVNIGWRPHNIKKLHVWKLIFEATQQITNAKASKNFCPPLLEEF